MSDKTLSEKIDAIYESEQPVQKYWPQITAIFLVVFGMGGAYFKIDALAEEVEETQEENALEQRDIQQINKKLTSLEANQKNLKETVDANQKNLKDDVDEIKDDVKEILRELRDRED